MFVFALAQLGVDSRKSLHQLVIEGCRHPVVFGSVVQLESVYVVLHDRLVDFSDLRHFVQGEKPNLVDDRRVGVLNARLEELVGHPFLAAVPSHDGALPTRRDESENIVEDSEDEEEAIESWNALSFLTFRHPFDSWEHQVAMLNLLAERRHFEQFKTKLRPDGMPDQINFHVLRHEAIDELDFVVQLALQVVQLFVGFQWRRHHVQFLLRLIVTYK